MFLNLAATCSSTTALGPGVRAVVWVQGCPFHCKGCIAPDWIPFKTSRLFTPEDLIDELVCHSNISGLTISGGEPMQQATALAEFSRLAKVKKDIDIICFTGYSYEALQEMPEKSGVPSFLKHIDLLIDGPFIQTQRSKLGLRGSENQRFIHLTDRLKWFDFANFPRRFEIKVDKDEILMVGIPPVNINPHELMENLAYHPDANLVASRSLHS